MLPEDNILQAYAFAGIKNRCAGINDLKCGFENFRKIFQLEADRNTDSGMSFAVFLPKKPECTEIVGSELTVYLQASVSALPEGIGRMIRKADRNQPVSDSVFNVFALGSDRMSAAYRMGMVIMLHFAPPSISFPAVPSGYPPASGPILSCRPVG